MLNLKGIIDRDAVKAHLEHLGHVFENFVFTIWHVIAVPDKNDILMNCVMFQGEGRGCYVIHMNLDSLRILSCFLFDIRINTEHRNIMHMIFPTSSKERGSNSFYFLSDRSIYHCDMITGTHQLVFNGDNHQLRNRYGIYGCFISRDKLIAYGAQVIHILSTNDHSILETIDAQQIKGVVGTQPDFSLIIPRNDDMFLVTNVEGTYFILDPHRRAALFMIPRSDSLPCRTLMMKTFAPMWATETIKNRFVLLQRGYIKILDSTYDSPKYLTKNSLTAPYPEMTRKGDYLFYIEKVQYYVQVMAYDIRTSHPFATYLVVKQKYLSLEGVCISKNNQILAFSHDNVYSVPDNPISYYLAPPKPHGIAIRGILMKDLVLNFQ